MRWIDLLRMSSNSLKRRKLRTFLTVLGVVIGTASIVVMISLGLGLQESMYQEIEQSGGVTSLTVTGKGSSQMGGFYMGDTNNEEEATKYTTDDVIEQIKKLDHVADVQPVLSIDALFKEKRIYRILSSDRYDRGRAERSEHQTGTGRKPSESRQCGTGSGYRK